MSIDDEREELSEFLRKTSQNLSEQFDSVQILASRTIDGMTETYASGNGNWHARVGMAHLFIKTDQPSVYEQGPEQTPY